MSDKGQYLNIRRSKHNKSVKGSLKAIEFENDGYFIMYIPALKLSAYGNSYSDANKMMRDIIIPDFCETLMEQPLSKVLQDLKELGWDQSTFFKTQLSKSSYIDVEGILRDFELSKDTKINQKDLEVAA